MSLFGYERDGDADALAEALRNAENVEVRVRAAELLGGLDAPADRATVVDALVEAVRTDEPQVAAAAVDALDQLGPDGIETLLARVADREVDADAPDRVRAAAFVETLSADVPELRMAAANALGDVGRADAVPDLLERFDDPDPRVRARAARACGEIGDARATEPLAERLGDQTVAVRREAADALGRIGTRGALRALLELRDDESETVRRIAVAGFGKFESERPVEPLVAALDDPAATVRRTAVYSLVELLSSVPTERSHEVRESVLAALSATDDLTVTEPLSEVLTESTEAATRRNAAWLLGRVAADAPDRTVIDALVAALTDDDAMTRGFAVTGLAEIGGDAVERELLAVAEDEDAAAETRAQAIVALGTVGGPDARQRLESLEEVVDDEVVAGALERRDGDRE